MLRVCEAVLPSAEVAVTVIAQRPASRSSGGKENEPSSATFTVVPGSGVAVGAPLGAGVGSGVGVGAGPPSEPRKRARTVTVLALVVVPSTAIAPLPYSVPSTGCETLSVG